jgi:hypothetical protein
MVVGSNPTRPTIYTDLRPVEMMIRAESTTTDIVPFVVCRVSISVEGYHWLAGIREIGFESYTAHHLYRPSAGINDDPCRIHYD